MSVSRRRVLCAAGLIACAPFGAASRAAPEAVRRVGVVSVGTDPASPVHWASFFEAMGALGYVEGRNLAVARAFAGGDLTRLPGLVDALLRERPEVVVTSGSRETRAVVGAAPRMPVVMTVVPDPVADGFAKSLARPGGSVTGLSLHVQGFAQKYVELLRELVPSLGSAVVVASPPNPLPAQLRDLERGAAALGVRLAVVRVNSLAELDRELGRARAAAVGGAIFPIDAFTQFHRVAIARLLATHRLPAIFAVREMVEVGGLVSYGPRFTALRQRAAYFVDRILRGAAPSDLPIEQPTQFELVINRAAASALGLALPRAVLLRADEVIG